MMLRLGNLSPEAFAERVGAEFTPEEVAYLRSVWSQKAALVGPDDFHIFDDPAISVTVGAPSSRTVAVFQAANERKPFNRELSVYLDEQWKAEGVES